MFGHSNTTNNTRKRYTKYILQQTIITYKPNNH